jgi:alpha-glucosidase (family GH31 glycosyl hydrolase)
MKLYKILTTLVLPFLCMTSMAEDKPITIIGAHQINSSTVEIEYSNGQRANIDFYRSNIFRLFQDPNGGIIRDPKADPPAKILVDEPRNDNFTIKLTDDNTDIKISTSDISISINKQQPLFSVTDLHTGNVVAKQTKPIDFKRSRFTLNLSEGQDEYFYGGGVQNGRFSHRGKKIEIVNTNSWTDGGVASPTPFYWSTNGYGIMFYTFAPGHYDFGATNKNEISLVHDANYLDLFFMVDKEPADLLNDYYKLTGEPVLLPKFAFYEGHLNAYNRDYWKEANKGGILFEDGKRYTESQKDNGGTKESLNGENGNYQFSARAVIDRYKKHDMPLGWILPNDGYGAGYGQTNTLDGNIANLKSFGDYARKNGVEVGLWTQSNLHPIEGVSALLQRDIVKEVRDAGVRVLKTDVAWVGYGYSFGLNGIAEVAHTMTYYGNDVRPFIVSLDGWAGTQRYAAVWSGDQTGGKWEYIRFHIPTYIGSGLSGLGNISSDMDGIFGGGNAAINIRDFQWKTFTPMQLNMDGWGTNPKYPHILGEPAASINRNYLKLKSMLLPYSYTFANQAISGKPLIRAMFLDYPNKFTHGAATQYQYMYGPYFLVAPIFQNTQADSIGNDIRNGIYLPEGIWIDYFTGDIYNGGKILSNFTAPIWKLPLFVKAGAIIPLNNANNNPSEIDKSIRIYEIYPYGEEKLTVYDDDGTTNAYLKNQYATTQISYQLNSKGSISLNINPTEGDFNGMVKDKKTIFIINLTAKPKKVKVFIGNGNKSVKMTEVNSESELQRSDNAYYYNPTPNINRFATAGSEFAKTQIIKNPQLIIKLASTDIKSNYIKLQVDGCIFGVTDKLKKSSGALTAPSNASVKAEDTTPYALTPSWTAVNNADYYEIMYDDMIYTTIRDTKLLFTDLKPDTKYDFKVRAVNKDGYSDWTSLSATTNANPLQWAIRGASGTVSVETDEDHDIARLFDWNDKGDIFRAEMDKSGKPLEIIADLHCLTSLDRMEYLPREGGSGAILKGTVEYSTDKHNWTKAGAFSWSANDSIKTFKFINNPTVRFLRLTITDGLRKIVAGREIYIFRVPGSDCLIPGDINQDGKIDINDLTSYINYTGLKKGDSDFDGYISKGDLNGNGIIDAADISEVATKLEDGAVTDGQKIEGSTNVSVDKAIYNAGDDIVMTVNGKGLKAVNAINLIIPYNENDMQFVKIEPVAVKSMRDMTNDRLHKDGTKVLYPTFVNIGDEPTINGDVVLMNIHFKALRKFKLVLPTIKGMIVDKELNEINW